jgi:hypothetical protein
MEGKRFNHYEVLERLGGGGMGVVYKALDTRLNRHVALKFLPREMTRDDEARTRFIQEAQAASALDHPNICTIHEIDTTPDGQMFIAMSFYDGETLKRKIERGPLPVEEALDIAAQAARGLTNAHSAGIVHRDIKPANVMITKDGFVKIVDFGIAKLLGVTGPTQAGSTLGTVSYMSPEQVAGEDAEPRSDVFALGAVLYEMLTGSLPFRGENQWAVMNAITNREPDPPSAVRPAIPGDVQAIVMHALEKERAARTGSAAELQAELEACLAGPTPATAAAVVGRQARVRPAVAIPVLGVVVALGLWGALSVKRGADQRWAREEALPQIQALIDQDRLLEAFSLGTEAEDRIPNDLLLSELWGRVAATGSIGTLPVDAAVSFRPYGGGEPWTYLGRSPLDGVRLPRGIFEWRFEKDGFQTATWVAANPSAVLHNLGADDFVAPVMVELTAATDTSPGMVAVPPVRGPVSITGFNSGETVQLGRFLIDRTEVTNRQFKEFVDAGGYREPQYWAGLEFVRDGRTLTWEEAAGLFLDSTGRPGPATWELGDYPNGEADYPVSGVSWYEAMAYARFAGKELPSLYHWAAAALAPAEIVSPIGPAVVPRSNFESEGPLPVGNAGSLGPYGTQDMAGNVREWCFNASGDLRWILGGGFSDPRRMFSIRLALPPFDRSPLNGFRTVQYRDPPVSEELFASVDYASRDYRDAEPVSDEVFEFLAGQLSYTPAEPEPDVLERTEAEDWIVERVTLNAGYDGERVPVFIYLPTVGSPPFQSVIYFPGLGSFQNRQSSEPLADGPGSLDFLLKSGRAVVEPVWNGSYERWDPFLGLSGEEYQRTFRARVLQWRHELGMTIDYLAERDDLDETAVAYFGASFGGSTPLALLAVEHRLRAAVLRSGGYPYRSIPPEVDPVNFVSRATLPLLMINGRYDYVFSLETAQRPLFEGFGTPAADKRHVVLDAGHAPLPRGQTIQETLAWLDEYVGPVR